MLQNKHIYWTVGLGGIFGVKGYNLNYIGMELKESHKDKIY